MIAMMVADAPRGASTRRAGQRHCTRGRSDAGDGSGCRGRRPAGTAVGGPAGDTRGRLMDRLLFGDNQFFGVNHMSEEKARAQAMRFQDARRRDRRARRRLRRGRAHLHVHDPRAHRARSAITSAPHPERYPDFAFYPVHAVCAQVRQCGDRGRHARRRSSASCPTRG